MAAALSAHEEGVSVPDSGKGQGAWRYLKPVHSQRLRPPHLRGGADRTGVCGPLCKEGETGTDSLSVKYDCYRRAGRESLPDHGHEPAAGSL